MDDERAVLDIDGALQRICLGIIEEEERLRRGALAAIPDHRGIRALADDQLERVEKGGFARAGLAG